MQIGNMWRILVTLLKREATSGRKKSRREKKWMTVTIFDVVDWIQVPQDRSQR